MNKYFLLLIVFGTMSSLLIGQELGKVKLTLKDGQIIEQSVINLDKESRIIEFSNSFGQTERISFDKVETAYKRKGSQVWAGLGGGFLGGLLAGALISSGEEWWHGAGPGILVGTVAGGLVGALIPRYEAIDLANHNQWKVKVDPLALSLQIDF